ncbi:MAG: hypothetical protein MUC31_08035 [Bacteroidales bacterium]|jgi:hypothetical protein|nr:hypothetical protein [Bacteroidales bacterium]
MSKVVTWLIISFSLLGLFNVNGQEIERLLPSLSELEGWKIITEPRVFAGDDLYELIDGGADIYHEYGFDRALAIHYASPSQSNIQVEIYEMTDAPSAYGIFSLSQQSAEWSRAFGNLSVVEDDYISFWKNRYYITLSWSSRQHLDQPLLAGLADKIAVNITDEGDYPEIVKNFQAFHLGKKAVYLKGNIALSNFYYFDYRDIFKLRDALACSPGNHHRIVIRYADQAEAIEVLSGAKQNILNNKRFTDVAMAFQGFSCTDNKGNTILIRQIENYIAVLVALDQSIALIPIMDEITLNIENTRE